MTSQLGGEPVPHFDPVYALGRRSGATRRRNEAVERHEMGKERGEIDREKEKKGRVAKLREESTIKASIGCERFPGCSSFVFA